jgi:glycosyltransferase involved in cell wall biosynthesis
MARILFVTPILPCTTGHGSAIRAGVALEVLSEEHEVTVIHAELWPAPPQIMDDSWVRRTAAAYHMLPSPVSAAAAARLAAEHLSQTSFDGLYVFRLAATAFGLQLLAQLPHPPAVTILDLDDDECSRTEKFLPLREAAGDHARAAFERSELARMRNLQGVFLSRFGVNLLASRQDRDALAERYPGRKFMVLPNVVRPAGTAHAEAGGAPRGSRDAQRQLLFLGSLDYLPNEDAVLYFCNQILPLLRRSEPVGLRVVGTRPTDQVRACGTLPGTVIVGPVRDVGEEYARARAMVVPLRAGSGTRIKILEAFSYGVPVVSTPAGAEGLDVEDGTHLLIAGTPEEFAAACLRLLDDDALADRLVRNAQAWLMQNHTLEQARQVLQPLFKRAG